MNVSVCISGLRDYPGLVSFGGRITKDASDANHYDIYMEVFSNSSATTCFFESCADDKVLGPFLSCYFSNSKHHSDTISVRARGDYYETMQHILSYIPSNINVSPHHLRPTSTESTPRVVEILKYLKAEGNELLQDGNDLLENSLGGSLDSVNQAFAGYGKAADLYISALYVVRDSRHDSPEIPMLVLQCFSNLLLACLKIEAFDVGDGVAQEGIAREYVQNTNLPSQLRSKCFYRIALIREKRQKPTEAFHFAIAAWHVNPNDKKILAMVNRYLQDKPSFVCKSPTDEICVLCRLMMVGGGDITTHATALKCGHEFHTGCIEPWLRYFDGTCPLCRGEPRR